MICKCFYCRNRQPHPAYHTSFGRISSRLRKAESTNPADEIRMVACISCGHEMQDPTQAAAQAPTQGGPR